MILFAPVSRAFGALFLLLLLVFLLLLLLLCANRSLAVSVVEERLSRVACTSIRGYRLYAVEEWLADPKRVLWCVLERTGRDEETVRVGQFSQVCGCVARAATICAREAALKAVRTHARTHAQ